MVFIIWFLETKKHDISINLLLKIYNFLYLLLKILYSSGFIIPLYIKDKVSKIKYHLTIKNTI